MKFWRLGEEDSTGITVSVSLTLLLSQLRFLEKRPLKVELCDRSVLVKVDVSSKKLLLAAPKLPRAPTAQLQPPQPPSTNTLEGRSTTASQALITSYASSGVCHSI